MIRSITIPRSSVSVQALWIAVFAVLTALGARLAFPHIPVPYTFQTLVVLIAGASLGMRNGALSSARYN